MWYLIRQMLRHEFTVADLSHLLWQVFAWQQENLFWKGVCWDNV